MQANTQNTKDIQDIAYLVYLELNPGVHKIKSWDKVPIQTVMDEARQVLSVLETQTIEPAKVLLSMEQKGYLSRNGRYYIIK